MTVRIVDIAEVTKPIASPIRNAYIDFSKMTTSLVAVVTNVERNGKRVVGYGFNSNGRYGQGGLIRERFRPRLLEADPKSLLDDTGDNLSPEKCWAALMTNEKPGGHGERSVAVGTIDMAIWDAVAKIAGKPLFRLLAEREGRAADPQRVRLCGGRLLLSRQGRRRAAPRDGELRRARLQRREDEDRRRRRSPRTRGASRRCWPRSARRCSSPSTPTAASISRPRSPTPRCCGSIRCSGTRRPATRSTMRCRRRSPISIPAPMATGENLFSHQDARNLLRYGGMRPDRDFLQFDCALSYGLVEFRRTLDALTTHGWSWRRVIPHGGHQMSLMIAAGLGLGGNESYPDLFQPYGGFPDGVRVDRRPRHAARAARHRLRRQERPCVGDARAGMTSLRETVCIFRGDVVVLVPCAKNSSCSHFPSHQNIRRQVTAAADGDDLDRSLDAADFDLLAFGAHVPAGVLGDVA